MTFSKIFEPIWADMDPNQHMRHTAYNNYAAQVRVDFFHSIGMGYEEMETRRLGAVLLREDTHFVREIRLGDKIRIDLEISGLSADGRFWNLTHHIYKNEDKLSAVIYIEGGWIHMDKRKIIAPPEEILKKLQALPRSNDFREIVKNKS